LGKIGTNLYIPGSRSGRFGKSDPDRDVYIVVLVEHFRLDFRALQNGIAKRLRIQLVLYSSATKPTFISGAKLWCVDLAGKCNSIALLPHRYS
jgi:hypothetical protein